MTIELNSHLYDQMNVHINIYLLKYIFRNRFLTFHKYNEDASH